MKRSSSWSRRPTEVKAAFDDEDFEKVVELVEASDIQNDELTELAAQAQAVLDEQALVAEVNAALDAEDFEKVVELVKTSDIQNDELTELAAQAQAVLDEQALIADIKAAYDKHNYARVVELAGSDAPGGDEIAEILTDSKVQLAYQDGNYEEVVALLGNQDDRASNKIYMDSIRNVAKQAILATGDDRYVDLPDDDSYLSDFKTRYVAHFDYDSEVFNIFKDREEALKNQRVCGPAVPVERVVDWHLGRQKMPWAYEGTEVTVLAEKDDMSFILYLSNENRQRAGWVQTRFLVDEFPGALLTVGEAKYTDTDIIEDVGMTWSKKGFLDSLQNYSVLNETVENCVGFTLDYQLIAENTWMFDCVFGPRTVYVNDGTEWIRVGSFDYPTQGTVKVTVNLEEPTDIVAIGTIAEVGLPNTFLFRQYATDFQVVG